MTARKATTSRQTRRARTDRETNFDKILAATAGVLEVDPAGIPANRLTQTSIGWLRAAMAQARAIVVLGESGQDYLVSPNRRSFLEIFLRLQWLVLLEPASAREPALDAMLDEEKRLGKSHQKNVIDMGLVSPPQPGDVEDLVSIATTDSSLRQQAKKFLEAAKAANGVGPYIGWREETQYTHATIQLAAAYAPRSEFGTLARGNAPTRDLDGELLLTLSLLASLYTTRLLVDAGVALSSAERFHKSFFSGLRRAV